MRMIHWRVPATVVRLPAATPGIITSEPSQCWGSLVNMQLTIRKIAVCTGAKHDIIASDLFFSSNCYTIIFDKTSHQSLFVIFRRNSHKLQKRGSMPESSGVGAGAGLVKHHGQSQSHQRRLIISVLFPGLSSQLPGKCRSGGMLMMKRPSCDINNSSQTSIVSGQLSSGEDAQDINLIYHAL